MTNIQKLIAKTFTYATEASALGKHELAKTYSEDWSAFIEVKYLIEAGYTYGAAKALDEMDTAPCESFVVAMAADGLDTKKYGYELN